MKNEILDEDPGGSCTPESHLTFPSTERAGRQAAIIWFQSISESSELDLFREHRFKEHTARKVDTTNERVIRKKAFIAAFAREIQKLLLANSIDS